MPQFEKENVSKMFVCLAEVKIMLYQQKENVTKCNGKKLGIHEASDLNVEWRKLLSDENIGSVWSNEEKVNFFKLIHRHKMQRKRRSIFVKTVFIILSFPKVKYAISFPV